MKLQSVFNVYKTNILNMCVPSLLPFLLPSLLPSLIPSLLHFLYPSLTAIHTVGMNTQGDEHTGGLDTWGQEIEGEQTFRGARTNRASGTDICLFIFFLNQRQTDKKTDVGAFNDRFIKGSNQKENMVKFGNCPNLRNPPPLVLGTLNWSFRVELVLPRNSDNIICRTIVHTMPSMWYLHFTRI